jgi:hypothetical protein
MARRRKGREADAPAEPTPPPADPVDPERILADIDERSALAAEANATDEAEHAPCNRLYEASHRVEVYDTQRYEEEYARRPTDDAEFCRAWARHVLTLAGGLTADGWWERVGHILGGDPQTDYLLAILQAAKAGDLDRTAWRLEQACTRGGAMYGAAVWLRGRLRDELRGLGRYRLAPSAAPQPDPGPTPEAGAAVDGPATPPAETVPPVPGPGGEQPAAEAPAGFDTPWPLGMRANLADRKVWRNGTVTDLGTDAPAWQTLVKLANAHPNRKAPKPLWRDVWPDGEVELGTVYATISRLRELLEPLGVGIPHPGRRGYVLAAQT